MKKRIIMSGTLSVMLIFGVLYAGCASSETVKQTDSFRGTWTKAPNLELTFDGSEFLLIEGEQEVKRGTYHFTGEELSIRSGSIRQTASYTFTGNSTLSIVNENWQMGGWEKFTGSWTKSN
jgi:hypothetical protein